MKISALINVSFLISLTLGIILFGSPSASLAKEYGWGAIDKCPSLEMLNVSTQAYHEEAERLVFFEPRYSDQREDSGLSAVHEANEIERLHTARHSAECQILNEALKPAFQNLRHDRELDRQVPSSYPMYYRVGELYVAIVNSYHPGMAEGSSTLTPPPPGWLMVNVYDSNLNRIGSFGI